MTDFWKGFAACYLFVSVIGGFAMQAVIPALNPIGVAYVGLTWPIAVGCTAVRAECSNIPPKQYGAWLFTFEEPTP